MIFIFMACIHHNAEKLTKQHVQLHHSCIVCFFNSASVPVSHQFTSQSLTRIQNKPQHHNIFITSIVTKAVVFFLFLFQSSSQTAIFSFLSFFFITLKTQPCTIQSSKSLLLQPQLKIVYPKPYFPHPSFLSVSKDGERGLLRYARWFSSFTKLDNNKSNNNDNNNLKSNIFCLCSILFDTH